MSSKAIPGLYLLASLAAASIPPIIPPLPGETLPPGWGHWFEVRLGAEASTYLGPSPAIAVRMGNDRQWQFRPSTKIPVRPGETWMFQATASGRDLGWMLRSGGGGLNLLAFDSLDRPVESASRIQWFRGDFPWKKFSLQVTVPDGVATVWPVFTGFGGGGFIVANASFSLVDSAADPLPAARSDLPDSAWPPNLAPPIYRLPVITGGEHGIYLPGDTLQWKIAPECPRTGLDLPYRVLDAEGIAWDSGVSAPGGVIRFRPPHPGYYELSVDCEAPPLGRLRIRQGSALIAKPSGPTRWGETPFGISDGDTALLVRLGFSFTRPLHYNIVSGRQDRLPDDTAVYEDAWKKRIRGNRLPPWNVQTVEVWNEPQNELRRWGGDFPMSDFVAMVHAARKGIRSVDPGARIAVNWENVGMFLKFHAAGGRDLYEVAALHPYSRHIFEPDEGSGKRRADSPERDGLVRHLMHARELLPGKEIWSTEFGWPTYPDRDWSCTEVNQARYIVRSALLQLSQGVARLIPYALDDFEGSEQTGSFGMRRVDRTPKPSLAAYSVLAQTVGRLPYAGRLETGLPNCGSLLFGDSIRTVLALWCADGEASLRIPLPPGPKFEKTLFGKETALRGRVHSTVLGPSPVYLILEAPPEAVARTARLRLRSDRNGPLFEDVIDPR